MSSRRANPLRPASHARPGLALAKRLVDVAAAAVGLAATWWVILLACCAARRDTGASGIFRQQRIGRDGRLFWVLKVRTMRLDASRSTTATAANDPRITPLGALLRRWKIDELPQLWNVLVGDMSLVGPRPEVPQHLPLYQKHYPDVLRVRPGVTCPATLLYRNEEQLLATSDDPDWLSDAVLLPHKLRLNTDYARRYTLVGDLRCLLDTLTGAGPRITSLSDIPKDHLSDDPSRHAA